ncbi:MAG: hypothetical protein AB2761_20705 [Candidatus Thiodiazotropha endolucinida]
MATTLLTPIHQVIDLPLAQLPATSAWDRLSAHWPAPEDRALPGQWDEKAKLFQYLAKAWQAIPDNSYRAICADLRLFFDWCRTRDLPVLPATPAAISAFLVDQAEIKAKSTVRRYLASIAKTHTIASITSGALFRGVAKSGQVLEDPLSTKGVNRAVQRVAKAAGQDPRDFSGHGWHGLQRIMSF